MDSWTTIAIVAALAAVFFSVLGPISTRQRLAPGDIQALAREHRASLAPELEAGGPVAAIRRLRALRPDLTLAEAKAAVDVLGKGLD